jgi:beta-barrel assembly-enhancing protease
MKRIRNLSLGLLFLLAGLLCGSCDKDTGFNLFTVRQDIEIGETMDSIIRANPTEYPILSETNYPEAYSYLNMMMQRILQSDEFEHDDDFSYEITIINNPGVMNAFAVPGGKLYFYTGLMKYLNNAANLAGVLAHEMAHVDRRHSSQQLSKVYGFDFVINALLGEDKSNFEEIASNLATGLVALQFSRSDEYEADEYSIKYMADTEYYHPKGIAGFFEQLKADGHTAQTFEFLSTHPSDDNRLDNIDAVWRGLGSPTGEYFESEYADFKNNMLP